MDKKALEKLLHAAQDLLASLLPPPFMGVANYLPQINSVSESPPNQLNVNVTITPTPPATKTIQVYIVAVQNEPLGGTVSAQQWAAGPTNFTNGSPTQTIPVVVGASGPFIVHAISVNASNDVGHHSWPFTS